MQARALYNVGVQARKSKPRNTPMPYTTADLAAYTKSLRSLGPRKVSLKLKPEGTLSGSNLIVPKP